MYSHKTDAASQDETKVELGADLPVGCFLCRERDDGQEHVGDVVEGGSEREEDGSSGRLVLEVTRSPGADDQVGRTGCQLCSVRGSSRCHSRAGKVEEPPSHVGLVR